MGNASRREPRSAADFPDWDSADIDWAAAHRASAERARRQADLTQADMDCFLDEVHAPR